MAPVNGCGVVVAVVDGGYLPHADLAANILPGYDFVSPDLPNVFITANDSNGRDNDASDPETGSPQQRLDMSYRESAGTALVWPASLRLSEQYRHGRCSVWVKDFACPRFGDAVATPPTSSRA
jgi:subtilisin family serine protease